MRSTLLPLLLALACSSSGPAAPPVRDLAELEARLEQLRQRRGIVGMSGAIACEGQPEWSRGFGLADRASAEAATPATVFHVASLTKTFASIVLLQLEAEGRIDLDDPVSEYGVSLSGDVRVRHLLSHTSSAPPGARFRYDGDRFALLDAVVQRADGRSFPDAVLARVIVPLGLVATAPSSLGPAGAAGLDTLAIRTALATGYDPAGRAIPYPNNVSAAAGLLSTVLDLLTYSAALDLGALYPAGARSLAWTPVRLNSGAEAPYGLGWFVESRGGETLVWHYGHWIGNSALIVKIPERGVTFVLLANGEGLSRDLPLAAGRIDASPFARAFLAWLDAGGCGP